MSANQAKLLLELAARLKSQPKNRSRIVASLNTANILTKGENFTVHYPNLKKAVTTAE